MKSVNESASAKKHVLSGIAVMLAALFAFAQTDVGHTQDGGEEVNWPWPFPWPPGGGGWVSKSCVVQPGTSHLFAVVEDELLDLYTGGPVVVVHGWSEELAKFAESEFRAAYRTVEIAPVFVNANRNIANVTMENIRDILAGDVTDWEDLGSTPGKIGIYLNGGKWQRDAFSSLLSWHDLSIGELSDVTYEQDYFSLEDEAAKDANAIVFGVGGFEADGLSRVTIEGVDIAQHSEYPLSLPITVGLTDENANTEFVNFLRAAYGSVARETVQDIGMYVGGQDGGESWSDILTYGSTDLRERSRGISSGQGNILFWEIELAQ